MDESASEKIRSYLKSHVENSAEKSINPLLRNPDNSTQQTFLHEKKVVTPFFTFNGQFTQVDTETIINQAVEHQRQLLMKEGRTHPLEQGSLVGIEIGLRSRMQNTHHPVQQLQSFVVEGNSGQINLREIVPGSFPILWVPGDNVERSAFQSEMGMLILSGDIVSPEGLFVALHESGHALDMHNKPDFIADVKRVQGNMAAPKEEELAGLDEKLIKEILAQFDPVTESDLKVFLQNERNAWAYALKMMAKLTNNNELLQACGSYIHEHPMRLNSDILRRRGFINF